MSLVKSKNAGDSLGNIKNDNDMAFNSTEELKTYVHTYYSNIYKQPNNASSNTSLRDITDFLGTVNDNPIVQNSKLSNEEKMELENDITLNESTSSINYYVKCTWSRWNK